MKTFKIYLLADNGIQLYGITVKCDEILLDKNNPCACYLDNVQIDFDMKINRVEKV